MLLEFLALLTPVTGFRDLSITGLELVGEAAAPRVAFDLTWDGAFRNERNHDALWIVLRTGAGAGSAPIAIAATGHGLAGEIDGEVVPAEDGVGCFVRLAADHVGKVEWHVELAAEGPVEGRPEVWAVEMVFVPAGAFELGDDDPLAREYGAFYRADGEGGADGPFRVESEAAIEVGGGAGELSSDPGNVPQYRGDGQGPIPASYPKGTRAFYVMERELSQGAYARFLGALAETQFERRRNDRLDEDVEDRHSQTIARSGGAFVAAVPERSCNFVTWDDSCAWLDFMGLRPMSEFEYEKAARGPRRPSPLDYPWGSSSTQGVERRVSADRDLLPPVGPSGVSGSQAERTRLAASYWSVLDLSGGLWERVVSAGSPVGRAFRGTHGDGRLDPETGDATNPDWPRGDQAAPGIGFRGGAEYFTEPSVTNPFSPVALRTYAAYDGAHRYKTYSARGCRTAPR